MLDWITFSAILYSLMIKFLLVIIFIMAGFPVQAQDSKGMPLADQELIRWMKANICVATGMPCSFQMGRDKRAAFLKIGQENSTTNIIERTILNEGISIYDASLWQIVLSQTGNPHDLAMTRIPLAYYWEGAFKEFIDIRSGADSQNFVYDPKQPEAVTSSVDKKGFRGFIFRILDASGQYLSRDPLDGKSRYEYFPNDPHIHWEDWKPIAGENAWVAMASMHLLQHVAQEKKASSMELNLARELARAAMILQADNGGIRMAPLGTYYHLLNIPTNISDDKITRALDKMSAKFNINVPQQVNERIGGIDYPPYHTWYYEEISTENNLSWYAALRMLYQATGEVKYLHAMERIEVYLKSVWDPQHNVFYQGEHFVHGRWIANTAYFASDVQNWAIDVLGPQKIDAWFGVGRAYEMWRATRLYAGVYNQEGLAGIGYTKENDRLSIEWTAGAILAVRKMAVYYSATHPVWADQLRKDAQTMRSGVEVYRIQVTPHESAYAYSSKRRWIPFGWFSSGQDVMSLASTAWIVLIDSGSDPFIS